MMFDTSPEAVIMHLAEPRLAALRWLLRAAATEGMQHYEELRCMCVRGDDMVCADGFRIHMLRASDFLLGDDAENLTDGVYRVVFSEDNLTTVFVPVDVNYPDWKPIEKATEDGEPGYAKMNPQYMIDALDGMSVPVQVFLHDGYHPAMIAGEIEKMNAVAIIMSMRGGD